MYNYVIKCTQITHLQYKGQMRGCGDGLVAKALAVQHENHIGF